MLVFVGGSSLPVSDDEGATPSVLVVVVVVAAVFVRCLVFIILARIMSTTFDVLDVEDSMTSIGDHDQDQDVKLNVRNWFSYSMLTYCKKKKMFPCVLW